MDNIKDRQFYWEVKQFFNGKPENNVPPQPKPSLKDAVSGVLKENNPYKQTNFNNNQTSVNAAQNAIQGLGAMDAANKPSCVAYTKNAIKNPFNLNEGFWDIAGGVKKKIDDYTGKTERDAAKNQPTAAPAPQRGPGGGIIAPPVELDKASENPEAYEGIDDRRALGQVPMGGEVVGPNGIQKPGAQANSSYFESLKKSITQSFPQNSQSTPSAGQYRNRGSSNMGMATRPNRPEAMTLQSAMAQQNRDATRNTLGQMGAVEGTNSSSGFRGSVLPPAGQLTSMGTQKENEFKFAKGSRLA